jgi:hypothetical protein
MLWSLNEVSLCGEGTHSRESGYFKREQEKRHHHINLTGVVQYNYLKIRNMYTRSGFQINLLLKLSKELEDIAMV